MAHNHMLREFNSLPRNHFRLVYHVYKEIFGRHLVAVTALLGEVDMGFSANIKSDATSVLQKVPAAFQQEVSDAFCILWGFENWRLSQDPVVDDTPANRLDYVSEHMANMWAAFIIETTINQRNTDTEVQTWTDIEGT